MKFKSSSIGKYFSAAAKSTSNDERKPAASSDLDYLAECALFSTCDPTVKFDIALVLGKTSQLSDGAKYQVLTNRKYLPEDYKFSLNNALPARQCSFSLLNAFDFLRYSPSLDGVFCVHCVLFSNDNGQKLISLPEKDWSNVHQTCKRHAKPPEHQAGKKASPHLLCHQKASNFIQVFEGSVQCSSSSSAARFSKKNSNWQK